MKPSILFALCALSACGVTAPDDPDLGLTQDELRQPCSSFATERTCERHPKRCVWFFVPMGAPCQLLADGGVLCPPSSGSCQERVPQAIDGGSGGGGSSDAGVGVACACPNGGVCVRQLGGPAVQTYPPPADQCVAPVACQSKDVCSCLPANQGRCSADPSVGNRCLCDNGIR